MYVCCVPHSWNDTPFSFQTICYFTLFEYILFIKLTPHDSIVTILILHYTLRFLLVK